LTIVATSGRIPNHGYELTPDVSHPAAKLLGAVAHLYHQRTPFRSACKSPSDSTGRLYRACSEAVRTGGRALRRPLPAAPVCGRSLRRPCAGRSRVGRAAGPAPPLPAATCVPAAAASADGLVPAAPVPLAVPPPLNRCRSPRPPPVPVPFVPAVPPRPGPRNVLPAAPVELVRPCRAAARGARALTGPRLFPTPRTPQTRARRSARIAGTSFVRIGLKRGISAVRRIKGYQPPQLPSGARPVAFVDCECNAYSPDVVRRNVLIVSEPRPPRRTLYHAAAEVTPFIGNVNFVPRDGQRVNSLLTVTLSSKWGRGGGAF